MSQLFADFPATFDNPHLLLLLHSASWKRSAVFSDPLVSLAIFTLNPPIHIAILLLRFFQSNIFSESRTKYGHKGRLCKCIDIRPGKIHIKYKEI